MKILFKWQKKEIDKLEKFLEKTEERLKILLLPKDPNDDKKRYC